MSAFHSVIHVATIDDYEQQLQNFEDMSIPFNNLITYVKNTQLSPHNEIFVCSGIDRHMHLRNTNTNRVESTHWKLKRLLDDSREDLCNCWDAINNMIRLQHTEVKMSFKHSLSRVKFNHMKSVYNNLKGVVSSNAIDYIAEQPMICALTRLVLIHLHATAQSETHMVYHVRVSLLGRYSI